jgi:hypothetical protein
MQHKHLSKKFLVPSVLFIIGLLFGFIFLSYLNSTFRIQKVEIIGVSTEERKTIEKSVTGLSTLLTKQTDIKDKIVSQFPSIAIKSSRFVYPNILILVLEKEKPLAYVSTDYGYLAVSSNGTILAKERAEVVPSPTITFYQSISHAQYQTGQKLGFAAIDRALLFISVLEELGIQTETVAIDSVDMIACKTKGFEVAFSQTRPVDLQTHEVKQIVRQVRAGALRIARLDLRFDKPVVQLPKK